MYFVTEQFYGQYSKGLFSMMCSMVEQQKTEVNSDKDNHEQKQSSLLQLHIAEMEALRATNERHGDRKTFRKLN